MHDHPSRIWGRSGFLAVSLPLILASCDSSELNASLAKSLWQSSGYGLLAEIGGKEIRTIELTDVSCVLADVSKADDLKDRMDDGAAFEEGRMALRNDATLSTVTFERRSGGLAAFCPNGLDNGSNDPELNFEVLWQTFDRHYAFFERRNVDWDAVYEEFRPTINKDTSEQTLATTFGTMLQRLGDAHVSFYADGDDLVYVGTRFGERLGEECVERLGDTCDIDRYSEDRYINADRLIREGYFRGRYAVALDNQIIWGEMTPSTGYLRIDTMEGFSSGFYSADEDIDAIEETLDEVLNDIGHLPSMIVDVRFNGGGYDTVSVAIANRFADQQRVFGSKRPFVKGDEIEAQDLVIEPSARQRYAGKVAVLTSSETASAAEIFVMAMQAMPKVTLIGTPTEGILSDELYRTLPNGWEFSLSNEIYLAHDGALYEGTGVLPDAEAAFLLPRDVERGIDRGIDVALVTLGGARD